jgi:hypothetical protein
MACATRTLPFAVCCLLLLFHTLCAASLKRKEAGI